MTTARWMLVAGLLGCAGVARAEQILYRVGAGDVLQVAIYAGGEKQDEFTPAVSSVGTITAPLIGEIQVASLTTYEVAKKIQELLAKDFYVDPQVLVSVKEYGGQVFVLGAVKRAGAYGLQEGMTVLQACLLAGGFTDFASLKRVRVTRSVNGEAKSFEVDLAKVKQGKREDVALMRGDRIDVPQRRF
ncbi:MAG: polysaccharide export protein [Candidatus Eisenbacteria bacterium]|uniref:Polysaccharide export protein n=1 Tax=Eiseniibacteriota bacterium TaxID=2212470 RepID=A0A538TUW0_UNCEI|nr:MAG: polysaccharide export protein [Candidatus Eisenbacteria bacterium]